jgi:hypothetical protein
MTDDGALHSALCYTALCLSAERPFENYLEGISHAGRLGFPQSYLNRLENLR